MNILFYFTYLIIGVFFMNPIFCSSAKNNNIIGTVKDIALDVLPPQAKELLSSFNGLLSKEKNFGEFAKEAVSTINPQVGEIIGSFENLFKGPENPVMAELSTKKSDAYQIGISSDSVITQSISFKENAIEVLNDYKDLLKNIIDIIENSQNNFDLLKIKLLVDNAMELILKKSDQNNYVIIILDYILSLNELVSYLGALYKENYERFIFFNDKMSDDLLKINLFLRTENLTN